MVSLRQIAEQYGISKSTARRRVLECFPSLEIEPGKAIQLDAEQASMFADWMGKRGGVHESAEPVHETVLNQVESDDESGVKHYETISAFENVDKAIQRAVQEAVQAERLKQYESERESLLNRIESLESEVERLHKALEREQMKSIGFWNRLGQKLLGSGK